MAKKGNTLNDLTKFLEAEKNVLTTNNVVEEQNYFQKEPVSLVQVAIEKEEVPASKPLEEGAKFIDSYALRKTSFEEVNELIKTLALENKMSVQQVITTLYMRSVLPNSVTNIVDITTNIQKSYSMFMSDFQRNWWKR
ncbi:MAG: hypothetical protein KA264_06695 [Crocinitomicaceae bacterium]|nr:hypothetical protein [Crocinitomicaceae bacterium]